MIQSFRLRLMIYKILLVLPVHVQNCCVIFLAMLKMGSFDIYYLLYQGPFHIYDPFNEDNHPRVGFSDQQLPELGYNWELVGEQGEYFVFRNEGH